MLSELVIREEETQIAGLVSITDATGFGLKHVIITYLAYLPAYCPIFIHTVLFNR